MNMVTQRSKLIGLRLQLVQNSGSVSGGNVSIEDNNDATIFANPAKGYLFSNWSGDASGSTNPLTISIDADKSITANFFKT